MAIISYVGILLLVRHRIHLSEIFGMYGYYGWGLVVKPINMMESLRDILRVLIGHLSAFLFIYGLPVVVVIIGIIHSFRNKDSKSFVFFLWGILVFLTFFAVTLKFSSDFRELEHMMRLHARYYFFTFPFFLIAFIVFIRQLGQSILASAGFVIMSGCVGAAFITVFSVFVLGGFHVDFLEWTWLNTFFPAYRSLVDPEGWNWWGAENLKIVSAVLVALLFLLSLYYAFSKVKRLYPYLLFFLLFSVVGNVFAIRTQIGFSTISWKMVKNSLIMIESTIIDPKDPVMLIGSWSGIDMLLAFSLSYENTEALLLAPESHLSDDIIPPRIKWVVLLERDRYNISARMQLFRTDGLINIYHLAKGDEGPSL